MTSSAIFQLVTLLSRPQFYIYVSYSVKVLRIKKPPGDDERTRAAPRLELPPVPHHGPQVLLQLPDRGEHLQPPGHPQDGAASRPRPRVLTSTLRGVKTAFVLHEQSAAVSTN